MKDPATEKSINFRDIISVALKRKWLIIIPTILVCALAYGSSFLMTPEYSSSAIIWIDTPSNVSRELIEIIGGGTGFREGGEAHNRRLLALENELKSQTYLYRLINDLDLGNNDEIARAAAMMRDNNPEISLEQIKYEILVDELREQIALKIVGQNQIEISVTSDNPVLARDMVNRLAEIMEDEKTNYELEKILDNQNFADLQLEKTENDYRAAIDSLTTAQSRLTKMNLSENIISESNRRVITSDIDAAKFDISELRDELNNLKEQLTSADFANARFKFSDTIVELRTSIESHISTLASMMGQYGWSDQNVINVNIRLNTDMVKLENEIEKSVASQFSSQPTAIRTLLARRFVVEENIDVLNSKVKKFDNALNRIDSRINLIPRLQAEIDELQSSVDEARKYRDAFKSEEATVSILSERVRERTIYKIIEPARIALEPIWPNKKKIIVLGLVLGLVFGIVGVVIAELFDSSFKRVEDVEFALNLPVLAAIPKIEHFKMK